MKKHYELADEKRLLDLLHKVARSNQILPLWKMGQKAKSRGRKVKMEKILLCDGSVKYEIKFHAWFDAHDKFPQINLR